MLDKRLRAAPHFNQFILSLSSFKKDPVNNEKLDNWLSIASKVVEDVSTKKLLMFFYFTIDLLDNNTLRETKHWYNIISENIDPEAEIIPK